MITTRFRYRRMIVEQRQSFTYLLYFTCLTGWYAEDTWGAQFAFLILMSHIVLLHDYPSLLDYDPIPAVSRTAKCTGKAHRYGFKVQDWRVSRLLCLVYNMLLAPTFHPPL